MEVVSFPLFFCLCAGGKWCLSANLFLALTTQFSGSLGSSHVQNARESNLYLKDKYIFYIHYTNLICLLRFFWLPLLDANLGPSWKAACPVTLKAFFICHSFLLVETALKSGRLRSCWTQENGSAIFGVFKRRFLDHWQLKVTQKSDSKWLKVT